MIHIGLVLKRCISPYINCLKIAVLSENFKFSILNSNLKNLNIEIGVKMDKHLDKQTDRK